MSPDYPGPPAEGPAGPSPSPPAKKSPSQAGTSFPPLGPAPRLGTSPANPSPASDGRPALTELQASHAEKSHSVRAAGLQLCRAHVPPSASSGRCAGARGRAGKARRAVAAAHWPLWTSLACMANGKRPGRGYRFGSPPQPPVGPGTSRGAERDGAGWGWAGNEGAGPVDVGLCPCGYPLSP